MNPFEMKGGCLTDRLDYSICIFVDICLSIVQLVRVPSLRLLCGRAARPVPHRLTLAHVFCYDLQLLVGRIGLPSDSLLAWLLPVAAGAAAVMLVCRTSLAAQEKERVDQLLADWPAWSATLLLILQSLQQLVGAHWAPPLSR